MLFPAPRDNRGQRRQQNTVDPAPCVACALSSSPAGSGRALHCWQRCLHRLVAGYGKYWGCVPWRKPRIANLAYLHRSLPRLPLRPFPKARNPHLQRPRHPLCKKDLQAGSRCAAVAQLDRLFLCARLMCNSGSPGEIHGNERHFHTNPPRVQPDLSCLSPP